MLPGRGLIVAAFELVLKRPPSVRWGSCPAGLVVTPLHGPMRASGPLAPFTKKGPAGGEWGIPTATAAPQSASPVLRPAEAEQDVVKVHNLVIAHADLFDNAVALGGDLVHQLHGLDDTEHVALLHSVPGLDEGGSPLSLGLE